MQRNVPRSSLRARALLLIALALSAGCGGFVEDNTIAWIATPRHVHDEGPAAVGFKAVYVYTVRDWITLSWLGRLVAGDHAWDIDANGEVADSSFYTNRDLRSVPPAEIARGPCTHPPEPPLRVRSAKLRGRTPKAVLVDATGRTFYAKIDNHRYPELTVTSEVIGSRILWALGYHVPPVYRIVIEGTGVEGLDGRRAAAVEAVPGAVAGHFKFDWFRMRREFRGLRVASAWINDTDRIDTNTLASVCDGRATYWLIDFNGSLGAWQGRPKEPWQGWRYLWDVEWQVLGGLTLGLARPPYDAEQPIVSPAVGRLSAEFDPRTWRAQLPNSAFDRMTEDDARWMARRIAALSPAVLEAIVAEARFSRPEDAAYVLDVLVRRRARILEAWGGPPDDPRADEGNRPAPDEPPPATQPAR